MCRDAGSVDTGLLSGCGCDTTRALHSVCQVVLSTPHAGRHDPTARVSLPGARGAQVRPHILPHAARRGQTTPPAPLTAASPTHIAPPPWPSECAARTAAAAHRHPSALGQAPQRCRCSRAALPGCRLPRGALHPAWWRTAAAAAAAAARPRTDTILGAAARPRPPRSGRSSSGGRRPRDAAPSPAPPPLLQAHRGLPPRAGFRP